MQIRINLTTNREFGIIKIVLKPFKFINSFFENRSPKQKIFWYISIPD